MYGLIGRIQAVGGQRDALAKVLLDGLRDMPGCLSYVVAKDPTEANGPWVTEVWESKAFHQASLGLPAVQEAIAAGRPLIAGFHNGTSRSPWAGRDCELPPRAWSRARRQIGRTDGPHLPKAGQGTNMTKSRRHHPSTRTRK